MNIELLTKLIRWAEQDEEKMQRSGLGLSTPAADPEFANWGHWGQGEWAEVDPDINGSGGARPGMPQSPAELDNLVRNGLCGTAFCIAGQAVMQSGYRLYFENSPLNYAASSLQCVPTRATSNLDRWGMPIREVDPSAPTRLISDVAMEELDLNYDEAQDLFCSSNDIEDLKRIVNRAANDRGLDIPYPDVAFIFTDDNEDDDSFYDENVCYP